MFFLVELNAVHFLSEPGVWAKDAMQRSNRKSYEPRRRNAPAHWRTRPHASPHSSRLETAWLCRVTVPRFRTSSRWSIHAVFCHRADELLGVRGTSRCPPNPINRSQSNTCFRPQIIDFQDLFEMRGVPRNQASHERCPAT